MTTLTRYLLRRNLFLLFSLLLISVGIYIISDLFQRIDAFLDTGRGAYLVGLHYLFKLPYIISLILPAVFLLAMVLQLLLMSKNRESIALQAGGISPATMLRFVIVYGLVWSCIQFTFSQVLGVQGERLSNNVWQEGVRGRDQNSRTISGIRFTKDNYVVQLGLAWPHLEKAENIHVYKLNDSGTEILATYSAASAESGLNGWKLYNVEVIEPPTFSYSVQEGLELDIRQDLAVFLSYASYAYASEIEIFQLFSTIQRLEQAGTNVEGLRTEFYGRFAQAGSILVMGILALAITLLTENLYAGVLLTLITTFFFHITSRFLVATGESGILAPALAAWLTNIIFFCIPLLYILSSYLLSIIRKFNRTRLSYSANLR